MEEIKFSDLDKRENTVTNKIFKDDEVNTGSNKIDLFDNCEFINVSMNLLQGSTNFKNCKFISYPNKSNRIDGQHSSQVHVEFDSCTFDEGNDTTFSNFHILEFIDCTSLINFQIEKITTIKLLGNDNASKSSFLNITIVSPTLKHFKSLNVIIQKLEFKRLFTGEFNVNGGRIEYLFFQSVNKEAKVNLSADNFSSNNLFIGAFEIRNINFEGQFEFKYLQIGHIDLSNTSPSNDRNFLFHSVVFLDDVNFNNSFLDGFTFNDVRMNTAKLRLSRSFIRNTVFSNISWPKNNLVYEELVSDSSKEDKTQRFARLKEVYQQLKHKSFIDNNRLDGLKFYRNEMDAYFQKVKLDKTESRWSRFLLRVDKLVSNFGQNYLRPLLILLIVHLIVSFIIWFLQEGSLCEIVRSSFNEGIWDYFYRLNPVHRPLDDWSKTINGIDAVSRFINGFLIYHFIKAIRRYSKVG
jgi:hypothetical protein